MKRTPLAVVVTVVQLLLGLAMAATCVYLVLLARAPQFSGGEGIPGLLLAAALFAPVALLTLLGAYGLARSRRWGWGVALLTDSAVTFLWVYSMVDDGWQNFVWAVAGFTAASLLPVVLLLLPSVRRFYWAKPPVRPPAVTHV